MSRAKSVVVQVNDVLRAAGRKERLVRGPGYFMLYGGRSTELNEAGFPGWGLHPDFEAIGFEGIMNEVAEKMAELGVALPAREFVTFSGEVHALTPLDGDDRSLCGIVEDAWITEGAPDLKFESTGARVVSCEACAKLIRFCKRLRVAS